MLQKGNKRRTQEATAANKTSSRSHALLLVNVKQTARVRGAVTRGAVKNGRLYMIDLAGSERAAQTQVFERACRGDHNYDMQGDRRWSFGTKFP